MKTLKLRNLFVFALFFILAAAVFLFTFYDLQAIQKVYIGENIVSTIFSYLGKLPAYVLIFISASVLLKCVDVDYKGFTSSLKWLYRIAMFISAALFAYAIIENFIDSTFLSLGISAGFGAIALLIGILVIMKIPRVKAIKLEKWCFLALIVATIIFCSVSGIKFLAGRYRYQDILLSPEKYKFTEWFKINPFSGGTSFPSGHVALASSLILIPKLLKTLNVKKAICIPIYILCILFIGITLYSRIIAGNHFPTDVVFSIIIACITYFITEYFLYRDGKLNFENNTKFQKFFNLGYIKK